MAQADQPERETEVRYRDIIARIPAAVWTATIKGQILFASEQIEAVTGFTAAEFTASGAELLAQRVHPADIGALFDKWNEMFVRGEGTVESVFRFRRSDERWAWLRQRISLIADSGREPYIVGISVDVTAQHTAEQALRDSELKYRTLVEQARDIIFAVSLDGRFQSLNRAFEHITGFKCEDWVGRSFIDVLDSASVANGWDAFRSVLSHERIPQAEFQLRTAWGRSVTIEATAELVEADGRAVSIVGIARDVTMRKQADAAAAQESRLASLGQLATSVAHEFNNVLMSIMPFAELLQRRFSDDERVTSATRHIIDAVRRGRDISQQVLRFSRPVKPALETVAVADWLSEFVPRAQEFLGPQFRLDTRMTGTDRDVEIRADRALLDQVVMNLLANARDAMPRGGTVVISTRRSREDNCVEIAVEDLGTGIEQSVLEHIFDPMFSTKRGGSGLGLTFAYQAMKQQDGSIAVSSSVGAGSTFTLSFREHRPASAETAKRRRMLLVEDDEVVAEGLRLLLEDEGFDVRLIVRGREAVDVVREFQPDLVLLDVNLPDMSGIDVAEHIRAVAPETAIIFSTGHADTRALEEVKQKNARAIMKPYDVSELMSLISTL